MQPSTEKRSSEPSVRIVRSATCPTLSGRARLSYEVGCKDGFEIQLRIVANSAAGSFTRNWIDMLAIKSALEKCPRGASITSNVLGPMFRGTSSNNQLFFMAILVHEGVVRRAGDEKRGYERAEFGDFVKRTQALIEGKGAPVVGAKGKKMRSTKVAPAKKPNASRKK